MRKRNLHQHYRHVIWMGRLLPIIILVFVMVSGLGALTSLAAPVSAAGVAGGCAGPVLGQRIYDCAHLLTAAEIANLETQAAAVDRAGAPTVVYLQPRAATAQQTLQDAIDLMNRWNVESRTGAHDGFVMFVNLEPGNLRHGQVALYAGEKHYQHGNLPQAELDRIRVDVMTPLLQNGETAAGIAAGLQMVAHDLRYGPPPPPAYQLVAANIGRIPFTALALLFAGVVVFLLVRLKRQPPLSSARDEVGGLQGQEVQATPGDLPPAEAGALLKGRIADAQIEATILDFARRSLLILEPDDTNGRTKHVCVRLLGDGGRAADLTGYEREVWNSLVALAHGEQGTISSSDLRDLRQDWDGAKAELRRELIERGWYDPAAATARRRPLYVLAALGGIGAILAVALVLLSQEGWAAIGFAIFLGAGLMAFIVGYAVPNTTVEGEIAAAPWRAYRASVTAREYEPNLDADLPYIVALGVLNKLAPRLKAASERGYSPSWFHAHDGLAVEHEGMAGDGRRAPVVGFYPYWIAFHASVAPASSGSASGGYSGGGAAGGGGGSAGGF